MITSIIVDDEEDGRGLLAEYIEQTTSLKIMESFSSSVDALHYSKAHPVNVIFLDIEMPHINGLEFAEMLDEIYTPYQGPYIIFSTAYRDFAVESYDFHRTLGYLLKPYPYKKFFKFVQKLERLVGFDGEKPAQSGNTQCLVLERKRQKVSIKLENILYVTGSGNSIIISLVDGRDERFYMPIYEIEARLPEEMFLRIHKSYIVSKSKIKDVQHNTIHLHDLRANFPIGITYRDAIKAFVDQS